MQSKT